jgi:DNA polymerase IV
MPKYIVHVDMDAFFAGVEARDNPKLKGKPLIIGASPNAGRGRGVVSTCSYEARKFGIHSAMPISQAWRLCPQGVYLQQDMKKYFRESKKIAAILADFSPYMEMSGLDEGFLDITNSFHLFGTPTQTCLRIKERIKKETGLTASIGLAPTKMAAKIASDLKKPDGFLEVEPDKLLDFLKPLDVGKLWGVGKKTTVFFKSKGINTVADLIAIGADNCDRLLGAYGRNLWSLIIEPQNSPIGLESEPKSLSNEETFLKDTVDSKTIMATIVGLSAQVAGRLRQAGLKGRTITLKIRLEGFLTYTRAITMDHATDFDDEIFGAAKKLYQGFDSKNKKVRLLGVKVSNFSRENQMSLFRHPGGRKEALYKACDKLRSKFGSGTLKKAIEL